MNTPLPLDAAAKVKKAREELSGLCSGERKFTMRIPVDRERDTDMVISDALDVAEALVARVAELEAEIAVTRKYADDCAELLTRAVHERDATHIHANELRDALAEWDAAYRAANFDTTEWCGRLALAMEAARTALAAHPAASLAAHDAEVLERARVALNDADADCECGNISAITTDNVIRALAAQAATHSVPGGTSEVKP